MNKFLLLILIAFCGCTEDVPEPASYAELHSGLGFRGTCDGVFEDVFNNRVFTDTFDDGIDFNLWECRQHVGKPKYKEGKVLYVRRNPNLFEPTKVKITVGTAIYMSYWTKTTKPNGTVGYKVTYKKAYWARSSATPEAIRIFETELDKRILDE